MKRHAKRIALAVAAIVLVGFGLLGLVLPIIPGIVLVAIGLILLSILSTRVQEFLVRHTHRFPKLHNFIEKLRARVIAFIGE